MTNSLENNIEALKELFKDDDTFKFRHIQCNKNNKLEYYIAFCEGLISSININENIVRPLMNFEPNDDTDLIENISKKIVNISDVKKTNSLQEIVKTITYGDTVLFAVNSKDALLLDTKSFELRAIQEPDTELILNGPREGFNESLMGNLGLLRRKLRTNELKMKIYTHGKRSNTSVCICYMDGIVDKNILKELTRRVEQIDIDAMLDSNYIVELIKDHRYSPFRTTGYTERPDVVVSKLLEGRIAIFVDGSPVVITAPYLFIENFQSNEDYYLNFYYATYSRILRILGFIFTISIPAVYIAMVAYHHEIMPEQLLISIASERQSVPLPAALEAFVMLFAFDVLKESGIRMPAGVGHALSIVGALVVGQAAVEAKLISAPMIIVVASTGITGLMIPTLNESSKFVRLFLLILASTFGIYGFLIGFSAVIIHILTLTSLGIPQVSIIRNITFQDIKDIFLRAPWWQMKNRPYCISDDQVRMNPKNN